jgi:phage gp46-like protein
MIQVIFNNATGIGDLFFDAGLAFDEGLESAVTISLLTRRRADESDEPPDPTNLGGFWGDTYPDVEGDQLGSRLWLTQGRKINEETLELAKTYAEESLQWMIEDGVAETVEVEISVDAKNHLLVKPKIKQPSDPAPRWLGVWSVTLES